MRTDIETKRLWFYLSVFLGWKPQWKRNLVASAAGYTTWPDLLVQPV